MTSFIWWLECFLLASKGGTNSGWSKAIKMSRWCWDWRSQGRAFLLSVLRWYTVRSEVGYMFRCSASFSCISSHMIVELTILSMRLPLCRSLISIVKVNGDSEVDHWVSRLQIVGHIDGHIQWVTKPFQCLEWLDLLACIRIGKNGKIMKILYNMLLLPAFRMVP